MSEFRENCETYQYLPYKSTTVISQPVDNISREKGYNFTLNNISKGLPFDLYNCFLNIKHKVMKYSDNSNVNQATKIAPTSDICRYLYKLILKYDGSIILDTSLINYAMNMTDSIEYSDTYAKTSADVTLFILMRLDQQRLKNLIRMIHLVL